MRDPETGNSKGFAFINFANFEASDAAIEAMNGQYLCNRCVISKKGCSSDSEFRGYYFALTLIEFNTTH